MDVLIISKYPKDHPTVERYIKFLSNERFKYIYYLNSLYWHTVPMKYTALLVERDLYNEVKSTYHHHQIYIVNPAKEFIDTNLNFDSYYNQDINELRWFRLNYTDQEKSNLRAMKLLDDAWNKRDLEGFSKYHDDNVFVYWPGQLQPTQGIIDHRKEAIDFFQKVPDNKVHNNPYISLFAKGDMTCSVALFTGTINGKKFETNFCTVAKWKDGKIIDEKLFYDTSILK